jgi:hypothetical protein
MERIGPRTTSVPIAGRIVGLKSKDASYAAAKHGCLPTIKFGRLIRVPVAGLEALLGEPPGALDHLIEALEAGLRPEGTVVEYSGAKHTAAATRTRQAPAETSPAG